MSTRWARNVICLGPGGIHSFIHLLNKGGLHTLPSGTATDKRRLLASQVHGRACSPTDIAHTSQHVCYRHHDECEMGAWGAFQRTSWKKLYDGRIQGRVVRAGYGDKRLYSRTFGNPSRRV